MPKIIEVEVDASELAAAEAAARAAGELVDPQVAAVVDTIKSIQRKTKQEYDDEYRAMAAARRPLPARVRSAITTMHDAG